MLWLARPFLAWLWSLATVHPLGAFDTASANVSDATLSRPWPKGSLWQHPATKERSIRAK